MRRSNTLLRGSGAPGRGALVVGAAMGLLISSLFCLKIGQTLCARKDSTQPEMCVQKVVSYVLVDRDQR